MKQADEREDEYEGEVPVMGEPLHAVEHERPEYHQCAADTPPFERHKRAGHRQSQSGEVEPNRQGLRKWVRHSLTYRECYHESRQRQSVTRCRVPQSLFHLIAPFREF